ncbi:MAG: type II secretion system minor pseudopilin GspI [Porticoccaceae bacterium]|nr:type II secretion system minor pseudopilin GspI [Porticoccaceae bacterium]
MKHGFRQPCQGFTLLELMVALTVIAIAALAIVKNTTQLVQDQQRLEDKTLALWLAENQLAEIRLTQLWPSTGIKTRQVTVSQREWHVATEITDTPLSTLRKVEVRVTRSHRANNADSASIIRLVGYMGEH